MIRILTFSICVLCLVSGGCTDDDMISSTSTFSPTETVPVKLTLSMEAYNVSLAGETRAGREDFVLSVSNSDMDIEIVGTPITRATPATVINEENAIYNFTVLQFAGTTADARLFGKTTYPCPNGIIDTKSVDIALTTTGPGGAAVKHRFVVITNTLSSDFNSLLVGTSSYSDFQNLNFVRTENDPLFPLRQLSVNGQRKNTMMMCGFVDAVIATSGKQIAIALQRTVAKVTFNIDTDNVDFGKFGNWDVSLMNIPNKSYFNILGRKAVFPSPDAKERSTFYWEKLFTTPTLGDPLPIKEKASYIPINLQQTVVTSTLATRRSNAPLGGTYLQIMGRQMTEPGVGSMPIVLDFVLYQIFLGKNLTTDFSVYPNYNLTYNIHLKGRSEDDSNVIRLIPGSFSGSLKASSDLGGTVSLSDIKDLKAVRWEYSKRIETYFADSPFPWSGSGSDDLGAYKLRWFAPTVAYNNKEATSLTDGYSNTQKLQSNGSTFVYYPAALACYMGLNGNSQAAQAFNWYLPSIGELIGTWISSSSMASQQSPSYWSSTARKDVQQAFIITNEGEVKTAPVSGDSNNRHYVRGCRNPATVTTN